MNRKSTLNRILSLILVLCCIATVGMTTGCNLIESGLPGLTPTPTPTPDGGDENKGYYFDSNAADGGDGSYEWPFNSLSFISTISPKAGENIYLKCGSLFKGSLVLENISGSKGNVIYVTSYGKGDMPKIDGNNTVGNGVVYIKNCSYLTVENLEIYDSATDEADRRGVLLEVNNPSGEQEVVDYKDITIQNLYIHDIRGFTDSENNGMAWESKLTGGIFFRTTDSYGRFNGLTITHCTVENVDNVGIGSSGVAYSPYDEEFPDYAFTDVTISYNEIFNIGKNAIFLRCTYDGLIEHNLVHDTAMRCYTGNSIVTRSVDMVTVQYNEGYNNMARANPNGTKGIMDGCMLDADLLSRRTVWQYNYSHDNSFGLFMNCTGKSSSDTDSEDYVIVRYNLSVNDHGQRGIIYINYYADMVEVYNNTIITSSEDDAPIILQANDDRAFNFYNNLICNYSPNAVFKMNNSKNGSMSNNLIYSAGEGNISSWSKVKTLNQNGLYVDPMFTFSVGKTLEERIGFDKCDVCILDDLSPAYGAGINTDVQADMFGNPYDNVVGCYMGQ